MSIFLGVPRERFMLPDFHDSLNAVIQSARQASLITSSFMADGHRVDSNRNNIVKQFLETTHDDHLLMLDSDMTFPHLTAIQLHTRKLPIVGGLYFHRNLFRPLMFKQAESKVDKWGEMARMYTPLIYEAHEAVRGLAMRDEAYYVESRARDESGLVKCDAIGTGAMMIERSVLEKMKAPWFRYVPDNSSEDLNFCYRAIHELDLPIYCDTSIVCGHIHNRAMGQAQFRQQHAYLGLDMAVPSRKKFAELFAKQANFSEDEALYAINTYNRLAFAQRYQERGDLIYVDDPMLVLELLNWNSNPNYKNIVSNLVQYRELNVLNIGGGIGSEALQLAYQDCHVSYVEPSEPCREFLDFRLSQVDSYERPHLNITTFSDLDTAISSNGPFDLVVAVDVLEHISDLQAMLRKIGKATKQRGTLFAHCNFSQMDGVFPMHYNHSESYKEWLYESGFFDMDPMVNIKVGHNSND